MTRSFASASISLKRVDSIPRQTTSQIARTFLPVLTQRYGQLTLYVPLLTFHVPALWGTLFPLYGIPWSRFMGYLVPALWDTYLLPLYGLLSNHVYYP